MDHHHLEDSLNIECMDFDHSEDVVNQEDIPHEDDGRLDSITMGLENVDHSHSLIETVHDEVIVSDLIEDPFPFEEFCMQSDGASGSNIMIDPNQLTQLTIQHNPLETQAKVPVAPTATNVVTVKVPPLKVTKKVTSALPRQVAIAPKPMPTKTIQYAIAPKPVTIMPSKQSVKKVPISGDGGVKGGVLAQIGRHLVMVPKKIKLMNSASVEGVLNSSTTGIQYQMVDQAQVVTNTNKGSAKPIKFIQIQGQGSTESSSSLPIVAKIMPNATKGERYLMQQKTVPISIGGNKVVQNLKLSGKNQIVAIKQQNPKVVATTQGNITTKRVVISNSNQKVLFRTTAPASATQIVKDAVSTGQRTQFHPINVPGKGVQYIKLVTNQPAQKAAPKPVTLPAKNFFMTDSKGNIIQMKAEKVSADGQSASVIIPRTDTGNKAIGKTLKTQKKLVRIAPVSKTVVQTNSKPVRSQSLLAPLPTSSTQSKAAPMTSLPSLDSPVSSNITETAVTLEEYNNMVEQNTSQRNTSEKQKQSYNLSNYIDASYFPLDIDSPTVEEYSTANESLTEEVTESHDETVAEETFDSTEPADIKPTLQSIISDAVTSSLVTQDDHGMDDVHEEIEYEDMKRTSIQNASFMLQDDIDTHDSIGHDLHDESNVIIVPATNYAERHESMYSDDSQGYRRHSVEDRKDIPLLSVEAECVPYTEHHIMPMSPQPESEPDQAVANLDMRPRKACNCTKSQCLKLYCDCFANGEFCNNCNCNNCQNNLENEEVRQKAIRSCLERNPNAFRPKIGKSKVGGPEIIRRHTKGCNCKRSGCLKNYCECYEAKIACTTMCKCVGCRNVEETLVRRRDAIRLREKLNDHTYRPAPQARPSKQPCSFMTNEVIEAVCQCLIAAGGESDVQRDDTDPVGDVIEEFARCLQDVISASHHAL